METILTSHVKLQTSISQFKSKGRLLNALDCCRWIRDKRNLVGWTYNYNPSYGLCECFTRLISCQGRPSKRIRIANNTHMKCYISDKSMIITSFNLSAPTINDLGIEIKDVTYLNYMKTLFNKHWKELE